MMLAARDSILFWGGKYWGLCLTAVDPNGSTIAMQKVGSPNVVYLMYSLNGSSWQNFNTNGGTQINLAQGKKVWFKASSTNKGLSSGSNSNYYKFWFSGKVAASGDISSLLNGTTPLTQLTSSNANNYAFTSLFRESPLVAAPDLPFTSLDVSQPFASMFRDCTMLTTVAKFPKTITTGSNAIAGTIYYGCTSLTEVDMSDTTVTTTSLGGLGIQMFRNCTSLRKIKPALVRIGSNTFTGCTALELIDFRHATSVIPLAAANALGPGNFQVVVPDSLYSSWIATSPWNDSSLVGRIVKASDYVEA